MNYDITLTFSSRGWKQLEHQINLLNIVDQNKIIELIDSADKYLISKSDNHCLVFNNVDVTTQYFLLLTDYLIGLKIDQNEYFICSVNTITKDYEVFGNWQANEFKIKVSINIDMSEPAGCFSCDLSGFFANNKVSTKSVATAQSNVVNDHVCVACGNNRCSKTESSCWKCGAFIT